jgi:CubicO group peptidase (beta-lactamase class C family)
MLTTVVLIAVMAATTAGAGAMATEEQHGRATGRFDRPQEGFASERTVLREGGPAEAGLDPTPIAEAERFVTGWTRPDPATGHPHFSGAVGLYGHDGVIVDRLAAGGAVRYADRAGTELPAAQQVPMRQDTIFDLASISKLFTSIAVMQLVDAGEVELTAPVARYLPDFGVNGKQSITVRQLLTHVSGLDADPTPPLWQGYPDIASRRAAVLASPLKNPPGSTYLYSDINLMTLGFLVEKVTGETLDRAVHDRITAPLGMADTGYNPLAAKLDRIAATEFEDTPPRGLIRGQVHDENAWSLGGVAGHAGVFSTAGDLALLAQTILNGGSYRGHRILRPATVRSMLTDYNQAFPGDNHGLGFELDQLWYMGGLSSPVTAGHTGFTGTTLVIDPLSRSFAILLTNRVHPIRDWGSINRAREAWATGLAKALAVRPSHGRDAWFSGIGNQATATLTSTPLTPQGGTVTVSFDAFVDSEASDPLVLETSSDGATWVPVTVRASGPGAPAGQVGSLAGHGHRAWWQVRAEVVAAGPLSVRWRFTTDAAYTGRGVYLDRVRVTTPGATLVDGERDPHSLAASGWQLRDR